MDFEKDIFISYAHIDDQSLSESEKGWITEFHRALEIRLSQLLGEKPKIWRDSSLDGNHDYDKEIVSQFPKIAILISILSPRYVKSEWCLKEVEEFFKAADQNLGSLVNNKSRVFKIVKTPVNLEDHPLQLQALLGYDFFQIDQDSNRVREFSKLFGDQLQQKYWAKLDDVAHDVSRLLSEIKSITNKDSSSKSDSNKRAVFLAETTYDAKENREIVKRWLEDHDFNILPNTNLPLVVDQYDNKIAQFMSDCELSIHILGSSYGIVPEGTTLSKNILQINQAVKKKDLNTIIWYPINSSAEDERQLNYIEDLKSGNQITNSAEFVISSIEELKFIIDDKLNKKELKLNKESDEKINNDDSPAMVYLICDEYDLDDIVSIEDYLFDKGLEVIIPVFEGEQEDIRLDHQENLKSCDAVLIYFGAGNDLWIRSKSRELLKIAGYGRTNPLKHKAIILAPKTTTSKARFRSRDLNVINFLESQKIEQLEDFVNQILNAK